MSHLRVIVGIPSGTHWLAQFGVDLGSLMVKFSMQRVGSYKTQELQVMNVRSSILPNNRLKCVQAAKKMRADFLLMLDSDHTFPADLLHRLIAHDKPVVAVNCVTKQIPAQPTARRKLAGSAQGEVVYSDDATGLERVWRVGTGIMLLRADVLRAVPHSAWQMEYKEDADAYQGEDWAFCEACERLNIPIYVDHDLSRQVGHIGMFEYTHAVVGEVIRKEL